MSFKNLLSGIGVIIAATVGAGIFALPMVFSQAGWATTLIYLAVFSAALIYAHSLYWRARLAEESHLSLLGLLKKEFGRGVGGFAFLVIVGGLILTLLIYLILGSNFLKILFPAGSWGPLIFWLFASMPILFSFSRFTALENLGTIVKAGIILFIFFININPGALFSAPSFVPAKIFLPFGAILFAISGWTAIEPAMNIARGKNFSRGAKWLLTLGTSLSALLCFVFVMGIFSSANFITADTISGLAGWPAPRLLAIIALGLFATWTAYLSISLEVKNSLEKGNGWGETSAAAFVIFAPLVLFWAGLDNLMSVIALTGGIFLSLQYLFIVLLARKKLKLRGFENFTSGFLLLIFLAGAIYEIYYFIVK